MIPAPLSPATPPGGVAPERPAAARATSADRLIGACAAGRFVPHLRNRAIGRESARLSPAGRGGLLLRADTEIALPRFRLEQSLEAEFDACLRPGWCIVRANVNSHPMSLELEVEGGRALLRSRFEGREREVSRVLDQAPLLLPDNAFAAHALAALAGLAAVAPAAAPPAAPCALFTSLPAGEELEAVPGGDRVLLGGRAFSPPAIRLRLAPGLDEHAWIEDGWVVRLMVPQAQMRVDWVWNTTTRGGSS